MLKKTTYYLVYLAFTSILILLLVEGSYRWYLIDFYKGNLKGLNEIQTLQDSEKNTVLLIGDSFTANKNGYIKYLRKGQTNTRFINSAIPGTCIKQHAIMMPTRVDQFTPDVFIYQIYAGNDFLEFQHPIQSSSISLIRKIYWWMADRFLVLAYINNKLPTLKSSKKQTQQSLQLNAKLLQSFNKDYYSPRAKLNFKADPTLIESSILLLEKQKTVIDKYYDQLEEMLDQLPNDSKIVLMLIPHCMQLSPKYIDRMKEIGAEISDDEAIQTLEYPLLKMLRKRLEHKNVLFVNPLSVLKQKDLQSPVYYDNDPHLNTYGQQIVGEFLLQKLREKNIIY